MNIDQLRYFKQICEFHSLNKAAQELYISQPALTKSIQALEKELNVELLIRTKNGVYPSEIGKVFLQDTCSILAIYDNFLKKTHKIRSFSQPLTIYAYPAIANTYVPQVLDELHQNFYALDIHFEEFLPRDLFVLNATTNALALIMDVSGITTFSDVHQDCHSITIKSEPVSAFVSKKSKWAQMKVLKKECLADATYVAFRNFTNYYSLLNRKQLSKINFTNSELISQEFILNQSAIHLLPASLGKKFYTHPDILAIPTENDLSCSYTVLMPHNFNLEEFRPVVENIISILKHIL